VEGLGVGLLGLFCCVLAIVGVAGAAVTIANYRRPK
jgi:hypothetical protein